MIMCFIGTTELLLIGGVALLFFGGKKLPEMMRGLGQGVRQFKEGMKDITDPEDSEKDDVPDDAEGQQEDYDSTEGKEAENVDEKKKTK